MKLIKVEIFLDEKSLKFLSFGKESQLANFEKNLISIKTEAANDNNSNELIWYLCALAKNRKTK